jgi:hypothetical protein
VASLFFGTPFKDFLHASFVCNSSAISLFVQSHSKYHAIAAALLSRCLIANLPPKGWNHFFPHCQVREARSRSAQSIPDYSCSGLRLPVSPRYVSMKQRSETLRDLFPQGSSGNRLFSRLRESAVDTSKREQLDDEQKKFEAVGAA